MNLWAVSTVLLWLVMLATLIYLIAITRQIGVLHLRIDPAGARTTSSGLEVGTPTPIHTLVSISGERLDIGTNATSPVVLLFVSTTCPACRVLVASLSSFVDDITERPILVFGAEDHSEVRAFLRLHRAPTRVPAVIAASVATAFDVTAVPYGFVVGTDGVIQAKGITNTAEHVESLGNAAQQGAATLEDKYPVHLSVGVGEG